MVAPVVGSAFGGYLTDAVSWRWAFYRKFQLACWRSSWRAAFSKISFTSRAQNPVSSTGLGPAC
ncbi:MAG: hypothetical protein ACJ74Y_14680 [Bryobacteraceae bacterium]